MICTWQYPAFCVADALLGKCPSPVLVSHGSPRSQATFSMIGRVGLLKITNPPVNSLGLAVRKGLFDGISLAEKAGAKALVIAGDGGTFPAGADIKEFATGGAMTKPLLGDVIERLDKVSVPTVAAVHGTAFGGGLELALACHWRLFASKAMCGLPEVHLGLLPGAGGTQRLPRVIGCEAALKMMTGGMPVGAEQAAKMGLVDEVIPGADGQAVLDAALALAERLADGGLDTSRVISRRPLKIQGGADAFFSAARDSVRKQAKGEIAPLKIVDAVEAAVSASSFDEGLARESMLFAELAAGPQARALQHVFFAEREISKVCYSSFDLMRQGMGFGLPVLAQDPSLSLTNTPECPPPPLFCSFNFLFSC